MKRIIKDTVRVSDTAQTAPAQAFDTIGDDLLRGAAKIANYTGLPRRRVYHLAERKLIPVFRLGSEVCARKSTLLRWLDGLEARAMETRING